MIAGENLIPLLSYDEGREPMYEAKTKDTNYYAFGSDDMFQNERPQKKTFSDRVESGKQVLGKFGNFFTNSVRNIVKSKESEEKMDVDQVDSQKEEITDDNKSSHGFKDIGLDFKNLSSKIGEGLSTIGSKTKTFASQTSTYFKQRTSTIFNATDDAEIKEEISKSGMKYQQYFDEEPKPTDKELNSSVTKKESSDTDVHFI